MISEKTNPSKNEAGKPVADLIPYTA